MRSVRHVFVVLLLLALTTQAFGAESDDAKSDAGTLTGLEVFGYKVSSKITDKSCAVEMVLVQQKMLENFDTLQKLGIFNSELPKSHVNTRPNTLSFAFMVETMPIVTRVLYEDNKSADKCVFVQKMTIVDDYGNDKTFTAFDYRFNRSLSNKINWDHFDPSKVMKVFPSFRETPDMESRMAEEMSKN